MLISSLSVCKNIDETRADLCFEVCIILICISNILKRKSEQTSFILFKNNHVSLTFTIFS